MTLDKNGFASVVALNLHHASAGMSQFHIMKDISAKSSQLKIDPNDSSDLTKVNSGIYHPLLGMKG